MGQQRKAKAEVLPCWACLISVGPGVQYCFERRLSFVIIMMTSVGWSVIIWPVILWPVIVWPPKPKASACGSGKAESGLPASPAMSPDRRDDG
jgi:hypothetical protein